MTATDPNTDQYRLPAFARPVRYELRFSPDLDKATFSGDENIVIDLGKTTDRIVMNAIELSISNPKLQSMGTGKGEAIDLQVELDSETERVTFVAPSQLEPGRYVLSCDFDGILNDKLCGFYRSVFIDDDGIERVIATTQFESTDARRAFPCFDEPECKAIFAITLDAPEGMLAISNSKEISSERLDDGRQRVRFADTIIMSTYLVCFIVGPLENTAPVDVDGVELRVVHLPGKQHLTSPSIDIAQHTLGFYADYFGIDYPSDKLDLVAIPDFAAGAMENLGCVTFREAILLADPNNVSQVEMERLAEVVEHELAHMWFGDLVTMRWWNGIWLNEAFATYMSLLCQDDYRPDWECFVAFTTSKSQALAVDGLHATRPIEFPVRAPEESSAMFDVLTYEKGASVLWMIDTYLGGTRFRDGVRRYLKTHEFANTETSDLWDAIEAEAGNVPIRSIMDSWIFQGGYPLLNVALNEENDKLIKIAQSPFAYLPLEKAELEESAIGSNWRVPVLISSVATKDEPLRVLVDAEPVGVDRPLGPTLVNATGSGFYRLHYADVLRSSLISDFESVNTLNRYSLIADTWAVILAELAPLEEFFEFIGALSDEKDPQVWEVVISGLALLNHVATDRDRQALQPFATALLRPVLEKIGWERTSAEDDRTPVLRASLVSALANLGEDPTTLTQARRLFELDHTTDESMDADLANSVLGAVVAHASKDDFEAILRRYREPRSPMDQIRHLNSLTALRDHEFAREVLEMCLGEIRSQNSPYLLSGMLRNRYIGPQTWQFLTEHFSEIEARIPEMALHRMLEGVTGLAALDDEGNPLYLGQIRTFLTEHVGEAKRRLIAQSIERLEINVRFARRMRNAIASVLARFGAAGTAS